MLVAHDELGEFLAAGVLEDDGRRRGVRDAGSGLACLEVLQLEERLLDLVSVGRIAVESVHGPTLVARCERKGFLAGDFDAGDVGDVERRQYLAPDEVRGVAVPSVLQPHRRAQKSARHYNQNEKFLHFYFL